MMSQEDKKALPDNVKVTGRHALCTDCVAAYAQHLGTPLEGDSPQPASTPAATARSLTLCFSTSASQPSDDLCFCDRAKCVDAYLQRPQAAHRHLISTYVYFGTS